MTLTAENVMVIRLYTLLEPSTSVGPGRAAPVRGTSSGPVNENLAAPSQSTAQAVLEIRRRSGLTWESLSNLFNVSRRTIHHWASGKKPSMQHELSIRRTLDAVRYLDEGSQRATCARLLETIQGTSIFDMLADNRFAAVLQLKPGAASIASGRLRAALSADEWDRRRPTPPNRLLESIQDRPDIPVVAARIVRPTRENELGE